MMTKKSICKEYKCFNYTVEDIDKMFDTMGIEHVCVPDSRVSTFLFEVENEKEGHEVTRKLEVLF